MEPVGARIPGNPNQPRAVDPCEFLIFCHRMPDDATSKNILARYAAGERDLRDLDLDNRFYYFGNSNLRGAIFAGSFILASFRDSDLEGADLSNCNVKTCDFSGAKLTDVTFHGSAIDATVFDGANLSGANFEGASAQGYAFTKGELPG
ncbi:MULTISPECIES: pentapeptide repeat-containing protein [unclassified Rhizobium]|uniref:pentapeptide repeat-containing protein n=1 Tax=unclassified Rhizobium TaxID=2613769 RepID=UPI00381DD3FF